MNNYHYIIASLPQLSKSWAENSFDIDKVIAEIVEQCSASDRQAVEFFIKGSDGNGLSREYYTEAEKSQSRFTKLYYNLDRQIRNLKVKAVAQALYGPEEAKEKIERYSIELNQSDPYGEYREEKEDLSRLDSADIEALSAIFANSNILEKERLLDDFKWEKINIFTTFDYFNLDYILSFISKSLLIQRWMKLDKENGKHLFRKLVDEVRGSFDKNKLIYRIDENNG